MAGSTVPLPVPSREMIAVIRDALVTRGEVVREGGYHLGAVYDSAGALIADSLRFPDDRYRAQDAKTIKPGGAHADRKHLKRAIYLGHAFTHFGHFVVETIPSLYWTRHVGGDVPLLFHSFDHEGKNVFTETSHGAECLSLLGIAPGRLVIADSDVEVEELLLPPRPYDIKRGPRYDFRDIYRILREAARQSQPHGPRIYLSRRRLNRRMQRLSNEAAVERRLERRGFVILHPQQMSFSDQINAVATADIVAGIDGSALHLSAFMRAGSHMLVMATRRRRNVLFLNALMDVETTSLPATGGDGALPRIELAQLEQALDGLGCPRAPGLFRRIAKALFR